MSPFKHARDRSTLLLTRSDVAAVLSTNECIAAVEAAFLAHGTGETISPGVLGAHVEGGGFHVKTAGMVAHRSFFAAKVNANFPGNRARWDLPTIQGALVLFDASNGLPLAIVDSAEITKLRTAAASAVAAKWLARPDSSTLTVCGCGLQGRAHVDALMAVLPIRRIFAFDTSTESATSFAEEMRARHGVAVDVIERAAAGTLESDVVVTCTSSKTAFLGPKDIRAGSFIAAVGADSEDKQELDPEVLVRSVVVADIGDQCAMIGELHHAIEAGVMKQGDLHGELADVVSKRVPGRRFLDETIVFDSTGTALEDVAAAAWAYDRAISDERGTRIDLSA